MKKETSSPLSQSSYSQCWERSSNIAQAAGAVEGQGLILAPTAQSQNELHSDKTEVLTELALRPSCGVAPEEGYQQT